MKKLLVLTAALLMLGTASAAYVTADSAQAKLPRCSRQVCQPECSPEALCVSGAHVKTCAEWCGGK